MNTVASLTIAVVGVFFLAMGTYALISPAALVAPFRLAAQSPESRSEIRAVYGGFGIAMAAVLGTAALDIGGIRTGAVTAVGLALIGMAGGRLVSRLFDTAVRFYPIWFYFGIEVLTGTALLVCA